MGIFVLYIIRLDRNGMRCVYQSVCENAPMVFEFGCRHGVSHTYSAIRNTKISIDIPISIHIDEEDGNKIRICVCILMACHTVISIIGYECCLFFPVLFVSVSLMALRFVWIRSSIPL